ncbi:hypothetical protein DPMN_069287 [Dreissena polymorpha]|uniref:Uncharacterized protein n=1 Tax=Dreissena polymorpha TaxID=45954 RepID=A0A9D3Z0U3_DREPO|nr:hypothetical protein DPMN_069287 [Dreissena polymorpha]
MTLMYLKSNLVGNRDFIVLRSLLNFRFVLPVLLKIFFHAALGLSKNARETILEA